MSKIKGWQAKMLSHGGRVILVKSVLQSSPIHLLSAITLLLLLGELRVKLLISFGVAEKEEEISLGFLGHLAILMKKEVLALCNNMIFVQLSLKNGGFSDTRDHYGVVFSKLNIVKESTQSSRSCILVIILTRSK